MNIQEEELKRFISDATFLEGNKLKIECKLKALKNKAQNELTRREYYFNYFPSFGKNVFFIILYIISMLIVHFIIVPVIHFILIDFILSIFQGYKAPPYKTFDTVCNIIFGILLFIMLWRFELKDFVVETFGRIKENKEKKVHDTNENNRLHHSKNVIIPKIKIEEQELQKELDTYNSELQKLYDLDIIPNEYCNLESMNIMFKYIVKYKVTDKKRLLNACDKYYQYKDLKNDVQNVQEHLLEVQDEIIDSFEDMAYSMQNQMDSIVSQIENQNYDLARIEEQTEREKRNAEVLLYWNLIN